MSIIAIIQIGFNKKAKFADIFFMNFVFICENGSKIGVKGSRIYVEKDEKIISTFPLELIDSLFIIGKSIITPDAASKLYQVGANIICLTKTGKLKFFLINPLQGKVSLRVRQFTAHMFPDIRYELAKYFLMKKLISQIELLSEKYRNAPRKKETINEIIHYLEAVKKDKRLDFNILRGLEGNAARVYFEFLKGAIRNEKFKFERREYRPARDMFNCGISFCYGMARSMIIPITFSFGFDIFIGFLHTTSDNKPSFALDLLEEFRAFIDHKYVKAVNLRIFDEDCFYFEKDGSCALTDTGIKKFIKFFYEEIILNGNEPDNPFFLVRVTKSLKDFEKYLNMLTKKDQK